MTGEDPSIVPLSATTVEPGTPAPLRIVHLVHNFPPEFVGGTEAYVLALAEVQQRAGHYVVVVCGSETGGPAVAATEVGGVPVRRLHHDPAIERYSVFFQVPRLADAVATELALASPDVVHVHHWMNLGVRLVEIAKDVVTERGRPRVVVSLHDFFAVCARFFLIRPDGHFCGDDPPVPRDRCVACCESEYAGDRSALEGELDERRTFFARELRAADVVLTPSARHAKYLQETGLLPEDVTLDPLALGRLRALHPKPWVADPDGKLRLAFFGNLAPVKGVPLLLAAVCELPEPERSRVRVIVLGKATDPMAASEVAAYQDRIDLVREDGYDRSRLERLAAEADVAVFPGTAAETYSLVVDEALALGLPVVVSDRGAAAERAGDAGLVVATGDVAALTATIRRLLREPDLLDRLRAAVGSRVFTIEDHARALHVRYVSRSSACAAPQHPPLPGSGPEKGSNEHIVAETHAPTSPTTQVEFDPTFRFLPLRPFSEVPGGRVVVLAPHPDDEIIGAGGVLALHCRRGDQVVVVHVTDGGGASTGAARDDVRRQRSDEARAAAAVLGVTDIRALDFPDGALRPSGAFQSGLFGLLQTLRPDVLYIPSPFEHHPDHRATFLLAANALNDGSLDPWCILYEVNEPQAATYLVDITAELPVKERALRCFTSQIAAIDIVTKTLDANRARTVNVDVVGVVAAEACLALRKRDLLPLAARAEALRVFVDQVAEEVAPSAAMPPGRGAPEPGAARATLPITCVISTWNKRDDVRENLLALAAQTRPPAEIVVVDNASKDGTADMIRTEFPAVNLIVMPHDKKGACETFNIGMKAATQPFTAIMDDDVVATPTWLERLFDRMEAEPATTAMVSSLVVEPGMPAAFLDAERRERYMATFRGCGTLARSDVLKAAGYYDEVFFIYGNERDLASRVLNLGYRILQYPSAEIFHKTPFGLKAGKRSLYYHVRNFWLYAFKYCSFTQIVRASWTLGMKGLGLKRDPGFSADASGTIGIDKSVKGTEGGLWIAIKATLAAFTHLPHCLRHRNVCRAADFEPPVK